jgi:hypothetical protein
MANPNAQRPLLYIQQPTFETKSVPMQQFYMSRNLKQIEQSMPLEVSNTEGNLENTMIENDIEPNVIEFMLEAILTPIEKEIAPEITQNKQDNLEQSLDITDDRIITSNVNGALQEFQNDVLQSVVKEEEGRRFKKLEDLYTSLNVDNHKKRPKFNQLSLEDKISQVKKMPVTVVRFLYEIVTKEHTIKGYILSFDDDIVRIQLGNSKEVSELRQQSIVDIKIIGF